ncbi:MAG: hypothetical protein HKO66_15385 [Saprospiraceae bacterium]|nr:hypothetical protein [Bacteroidia bacterium]NNE15106.1 hypothetical protein [Saprospiraceae bacterium]NNL93624.1 hypothetical protein [Saprospiraceae bacterium]
MDRYFLFLCFSIVLIFISCDKEETQNIPVDEETESNLLSECEALCIPPFGVDTSCIQMQMKIDDIPYTPTATFACIIPHFSLGINQIWINGLVSPAFRAITLKVPENVEKGSYPIFMNSEYDAFYVPSINANNFLAIDGRLEIIEHDTISKYILGNFNCIAQDLNTGVQPTVNFTDGCFSAFY